MLHNEPGTKKAQIVETHDLTTQLVQRELNSLVISRQRGPSISSLTNDNKPESTMSVLPKRETEKHTFEHNLELIHVLYSGPHVPSPLKEQEMRIRALITQMRNNNLLLKSQLCPDVYSELIVGHMSKINSISLILFI